MSTQTKTNADAARNSAVEERLLTLTELTLTALRGARAGHGFLVEKICKDVEAVAREAARIASGETPLQEADEEEGLEAA